MYAKSFLLLFILSIVEADVVPKSARSCPYPTFKHGRFRIRQRSKLIKFMCFPGYQLVGNKYATCRDGEWDEPLPVCVKPGCNIERLDNGIQWKLRNGAWVVSFCLPGYDLVGSSAIYCDGYKWNGTFPTCVDSKAPSKLSCDFEEADLCGWNHDELHDFDWTRLNRRTPSSFLKTGPSYDHTYGEGGSGYYMYIESTSRMANDAARLISPIYDEALTRNGCFSFYYHMFGKTIGGLRVYQKPDSIQLASLVKLPDADRQKYILFEKWGNQDDIWYRDVSKLTNFSESFQIVIEGIRGMSFTSDIAIDDVAILQGENCTVAATTPEEVSPESCADRCDVYANITSNIDISRCGCSALCLYNGNCCADFFEICVFTGSSSGDDTTPVELPQTQKLVASSTTSTSTTTKPTTSPTTKTTPKTVPTTKITTKSTTKLTTTKSTTKLTTTKPTTKLTTKKIPTLVLKSTTPNAKGKIQKNRTNKPKLVETTSTTTVKTTKVVRTTPVPFTTKFVNDRMKMEKEQTIEAGRLGADAKSPSQSSGLKTSVITITALLCCAGAVWLAVVARGARGRAAIARLRGRAVRDPEVRYLNADVDDD